MISLKDSLPKAKSNLNTNYDHSNDLWFKIKYNISAIEHSDPNHVPLCSKRAGFKSSRPYDFGDGGAFPEISCARYPHDMGRAVNSKPCVTTLPLTVDENGNVRYDLIVKQNENAKKIVYSQYSDVVPMLLKDNDEENVMDVEEKQKLIDETTQATKAAIERILHSKIVHSDSKLIKYKPFEKSGNFNSGAKERIINIVDLPVDILEPKKFKHKKVPEGSSSPPVPIMCSPPRPVTVKDQQDWKIPPCVSNWKNPKGYTIPMEQRLGAVGGVLEEVKINDNFCKLSEALYVAEQKAREAVVMRTKVQKERVMKEKEKNEIELRELARKARLEKTEKGSINNIDMKVGNEIEETGECSYRDKIREERCRDRKRERMTDAKNFAISKKTKICRDRDRDISENIALGMAATGGRGVEVMYDERLFNQDKGMDSGFGAHDSYNIYENGVFATQSFMTTLYKPKKDMDDEMYGGADERYGLRERPVEFEIDENSKEDIFGLGKFLTDLKTSKKSN